MMPFYTSCVTIGNNVCYRGYDENGKRIKQKIPYKPSLFVPTNKVTKWKTIYGQCVDKTTFDNIKAAKDFVRSYEDIHNFKVYGNTNFHICYLNEVFPETVEFDEKKLRVLYIDIETTYHSGFPDPEIAQEEVIAITMKLNDSYYVYGCKDYTPAHNKIYYFKCADEKDLLKRFLAKWEELDCDIVSGYNINSFDIPYLINRISKLFSEDTAKKLSPWRHLSTRRVTLLGQENNFYDISGLAILDYWEMYKKFKGSSDNYKLHTIATKELGEGKVQFQGSLIDLYNNEYQKFIDYNIVDTKLVNDLDDKMKFISMVCGIAYDAKAKFTDVFTQVRLWDGIIYQYFRENDLVYPQKQHNIKNEKFEGAYVKEPQIGMHDWVVSFDLDSLYPCLIRHFNISPDTLDSTFRQVSVDQLLAKEIDLSELKTKHLTMTANGAHFSTESEGFLGKILMRLYEERKRYKQLKIEAEKKLEKVSDEINKRIKEEKITSYQDLSLEELQTLKQTLIFEVAKNSNTEKARKVCLNSAYGSLGNNYSRLYDVRLAEAVTLSGQLVIRWIEKRINQYLNKTFKTVNEDYVVAMDTDSAIIKLDKLVTLASKEKSLNRQKVVDIIDKYCNDCLQREISSACAELSDYLNAYDNSLHMKRECIADKAIWTAKKRYIMNICDKEGVRYKEPELKISGIEAVKSSTPKICRDKIKDALKIIMNKDEGVLHSFILETETQFKKLDAADISFPRTCNGLEKYSDRKNVFKLGTPIHVRGALLYNKILKENKLDKKYPLIRDGEKVKYLHLKIPNPIQSHVISIVDELPPELKFDKFIDYELQFDKSFKEPLRLVLDVIGWTTEHINDLSSFFE